MHKQQLAKAFQTTTRRILLSVGLAIGLSACVGLACAAGAAGDSWQEEVLLHDGQRILIERSQTYGGGSEIGQDAPVADHTIKFTVPKGQQTLVWNSPFDREVGRTSLRLLAVHSKDGAAYVVTEPNLCLSYNKWGRPNPPYVIFKWESNNWQRIGIEALPQEFSTMNVSQRLARMWARDRNGTTVTAQQIQAENATNQPQYRSILREAMANDGNSCRLEFTNGKGLWLGADWFSGKKDLQSCKALCKREDFSEATCPCSQFFKGE